MDEKELKEVWDSMIADYILPDATDEEKKEAFNQLLEEECITVADDEIQVSYGNDFYAFDDMGFLKYELVTKKK